MAYISDLTDKEKKELKDFSTQRIKTKKLLLLTIETFQRPTGEILRFNPPLGYLN